MNAVVATAVLAGWLTGWLFEHHHCDIVKCEKKKRCFIVHFIHMLGVYLFMVRSAILHFCMFVPESVYFD